MIRLESSANSGDTHHEPEVRATITLGVRDSSAWGPILVATRLVIEMSQGSRRVVYTFPQMDTDWADA